MNQPVRPGAIQKRIAGGPRNFPRGKTRRLSELPSRHDPFEPAMMVSLLPDVTDFFHAHRRHGR